MPEPTTPTPDAQPREEAVRSYPNWPEYLMIRDTGLHDDQGGLGQRIYTTAGAGSATFVKTSRSPPPLRPAGWMRWR